MSKTNGPRVTLKMSCADCSHCENVPYRVQGDSGHDVYCRQPEADHGHIKRIGDTTWDTPGWCPLRPPGPDEIRSQLAASDAACATLREVVERLQRDLVQMTRERDSAKRDAKEWHEVMCATDEERIAMQGERDSMSLSLHCALADLSTAAARAGQREDEYPLQAITRALEERDALRLSDEDRAALRTLRQLAMSRVADLRRTIDDAGWHDNYTDAARASDGKAKLDAGLVVLDRLIGGVKP